MAKQLYKIVGMSGEPLHGGSGAWCLPVGKRAGKWMPLVTDVSVCNRGYHLIPATAIVEWLPPSGVIGRLFKAEGRGDQSRDGKKIAFAEARLLKVVGILDEVSMRLAAADFAERVALAASLAAAIAAAKTAHSKIILKRAAERLKQIEEHAP